MVHGTHDRKHQWRRESQNQKHFSSEQPRRGMDPWFRQQRHELESSLRCHVAANSWGEEVSHDKENDNRAQEKTQRRKQRLQQRNSHRSHCQLTQRGLKFRFYPRTELHMLLTRAMKIALVGEENTHCTKSQKFLPSYAIKIGQNFEHKTNSCIHVLLLHSMFWFQGLSTPKPRPGSKPEDLQYILTKNVWSSCCRILIFKRKLKSGIQQ